MISTRLTGLARCPDCRGVLADGAEALTCTSCGRRCARGPGYLDLRPVSSFTEQTKYLDESLHADARHETVSPPLLQAGVRQRMLTRMLQPGPGDVVIDLGCGSGRSLVWNHPAGADLVGIDVAPYFAREAIDRADLVLGDLRRLPFADGAFTKAYALDVFEHLSRESLAEVLAEIARVMPAGGRLFVYSHVRKNSWMAGGLRGINRLARQLERVGLIDLRQERLRKSDHLNPLADLPDLERVVSAAGFSVARIRYYTPLVGAFVENILMRMAERALGRRGGAAVGSAARPSAAEGTGGSLRSADEQAAHEARLARTAAKQRLAARGPLYYALRGVTALMTLDVWIFGRVRTGPFFVLLQKK